MIDTSEAAVTAAAGPKEESKTQQKTVEENGGSGKAEGEEVNNYARYHSLWTIHNYLSNPLQVSAEITVTIIL